jgi:hypothetical protein
MSFVAFTWLSSDVGWCGCNRPERTLRGDRWADRRVPEVVLSAGFPRIYWRRCSGMSWHYHIHRPQVSRRSWLPIPLTDSNRYGDKSMLWYISICSLIGGLSVSCTSGLGAAIVTSIMGDNQVLCLYIVTAHQNSILPHQFKHWFTFFLLGFVTITLLTEIFYLNKALALFNTVGVSLFIAADLLTLG